MGLDEAGGVMVLVVMISNATTMTAGQINDRQIFTNRDDVQM